MYTVYMFTQTVKFIAILSISFSIVSVAFAQSNPSNPGGGTTNTPSITTNPSGNSSNTPSGITPITPITPDISSEQIIEGSDKTTPSIIKAPSINQPSNTTTTNTQTPTITNSNINGNAQAAAIDSNTARTGGLEIGLGVFAIAALGLGYYYYKKRGDRKANLKTQEQKLKF
jgi:hypothetical protein